MSNAIAFVAGCLLWFLGYVLWRQIAGLRRDRMLVQKLGAELEALLPRLKQTGMIVLSGGAGDGETIGFPDSISRCTDEAEETYVASDFLADGRRVYRLARVEKL